MTPRTTRASRAATGASVGTQDPRAPGRRRRELVWIVALGVALAVQLVVLYAPSGTGGPKIAGLDKVVHAFVFFAPALAALMIGIRARWAIGILLLHAPVSELIQAVGLPQRDGDVLDVMADLTGVMLGGLAYMVWKRRQP